MFKPVISTNVEGECWLLCSRETHWVKTQPHNNFGETNVDRGRCCSSHRRQGSLWGKEQHVGRILKEVCVHVGGWRGSHDTQMPQNLKNKIIQRALLNDEATCLCILVSPMALTADNAPYCNTWAVRNHQNDGCWEPGLRNHWHLRITVAPLPNPLYSILWRRMNLHWKPSGPLFNQPKRVDGEDAQSASSLERGNQTMSIVCPACRATWPPFPGCTWMLATSLILNWWSLGSWIESAWA